MSARKRKADIDRRNSVFVAMDLVSLAVFYHAPWAPVASRPETLKTGLNLHAWRRSQAEHKLYVQKLAAERDQWDRLMLNEPRIVAR